MSWEKLKFDKAQTSIPVRLFHADGSESEHLVVQDRSRHPYLSLTCRNLIGVGDLFDALRFIVQLNLIMNKLTFVPLPVLSINWLQALDCRTTKSSTLRRSASI